LDRSLAGQRRSLSDLSGSGPVTFVPIDFTLPEDGFIPADYGIDALWRALE